MQNWIEILFFVIGGGVTLDQFRRHGVIGGLALSVFLVLTFFSYRGIITEFWHGTPGDNPKPFEPKETPTPGPSLHSRPVFPDPDVASIVRARALIGTLPPQGIAAISLQITNGSFVASMKNIIVATWAYTGNKFSKFGEYRIDYIETGASRSVERAASPIWYGKIVLCIKYEYKGNQISEVFFFQSTGEEIRYPPMLEAQQFRDPIVRVGTISLCNSMPEPAISALN